jgi:hypothetical protein
VILFLRRPLAPDNLKKATTIFNKKPDETEKTDETDKKVIPFPKQA